MRPGDMLACKIFELRERNQMADDDNRCAHGGCGCAVTGDNEYCSDHCKDADDQDMVEIACDCGHPGCG